MQINKDTKLYGSFSTKPGNLGCLFFNEKFREHGINAIYKSFYADGIRTIIDCAEKLAFAGFAIGAPYKIRAYEYFRERNRSLMTPCESINTVVYNSSVAFGYNTDFHAAEILLPRYITEKEVIIVGKGGLSLALQTACIKHGILYHVIVRNTLEKVNNFHSDIPVINATPAYLIFPGRRLLDCKVETPFGNEFHNEQAKEQFRLYTGITL